MVASPRPPFPDECTHHSYAFSTGLPFPNWELPCPGAMCPPHICSLMHIYSKVYAHMDTQEHPCMCVCMHAHVYTCPQSHIYFCVHAYVHTLTHSRMQTHTHPQTTCTCVHTHTRQTTAVRSWLLPRWCSSCLKAPPCGLRLMLDFS